MTVRWGSEQSLSSYLTDVQARGWTVVAISWGGHSLLTEHPMLSSERLRSLTLSSELRRVSVPYMVHISRRGSGNSPALPTPAHTHTHARTHSQNICSHLTITVQHLESWDVSFPLATYQYSPLSSARAFFDSSSSAFSRSWALAAMYLWWLRSARC